MNQPLDIAVGRIRPAESTRDWGYIRPAPLRIHGVTAGEAVWVTALHRVGTASDDAQRVYQSPADLPAQDGCYCDFATDIPAVEGMSGSPFISAQGEVVGILTLAGSGKFRGIWFGASLEEAAPFLKVQGVIGTRDSP